MKQVTQTQRDGQVRVDQVPPPALRPGGVLVRTACSLISAGTERAKVELAQKTLVGKARARPAQARQVLETIQQQGPVATYRKVMNRLEALEPLGYSCSGVVIAVGRGAEEFQVGDLVACAGAGYANHAEVNFVPKNLCVKLPSRLARSGAAGPIGLDSAAFATVGAIALQGVRQADLRLGESVAVIGLGLIGLLTVQMLKAAGCIVLGTDPAPDRCRLAEALGCDAATAESEQLAGLATQLTGGYGVDAAIITASTSSDEPIATAGQLCRDRGRVVVVGAVGMNISRELFYNKELDLRLSRSYGPGRYDPAYEEQGHDYPIGYVRWTERRNMEAFLRLIAASSVDVRPLTTHRFPIERAPDAYRLISDGSEPYLGVLLEYDTLAADNQAQQGEAAVADTKVWIDAGNTGAARSSDRLAEGERTATSQTPGVVRVGLIGAGNFAQDVLLPALKASKEASLRGVVTTTGLSARSVAERFGFAYATSNPAQIFSDPQIDAVVIATRHNSHASLAREALKAGKAVFVEKPLAVDELQLRALVEAYREAASAGRTPLVLVGYNRRFAPATRIVKELFAERAEPISIHCRVNAGYLPRNHWLHDPAVGGGRIVGEGCHFVDLIAYLAGGEPVEVYAQALPDSGRYQQDNIAVQIRFANSSIGTLQYLANGDKRISKERVEVFGGGAVAVIDDFRQVTLSRGGKVKRIGRWWSQQDKGHSAEIRAFLDAARAGTVSPIPFHEAALSTLVTFKILESLQTGAPVSVKGLHSPVRVVGDGSGAVDHGE